MTSQTTEPDPVGDDYYDDDYTRFDDLDRFLRLPAVNGLLLSPDGRRLISGVITAAADGGYRQALWEIDPSGQRPARRITYGAAGEQAVGFLPDGDLLFLSARPDTERRTAGSAVALWSLPASGGEARVLARRSGGIARVAVGRHSGTVVLASPTMPSAVTEADDQRIRARRRAEGVDAVLHAGGPVRYGDRTAGADEIRLFAVQVDRAARRSTRELTPRPGRALHEAAIAVSPDGSTVATTWQVPESGGGVRRTIVLLGLADGHLCPLLDDPDGEYLQVSYSPDGRYLAALWESRTSPTRPPRRRLVVVEARPGGRSRTLQTWDAWPTTVPVWSPDGKSLFVTADDHGRTPVFRVDLADAGAPDRIVRLAVDDGAYTDLQPGPDGSVLYALRSALDAPPVPVRLDARNPGRPRTLPVPVPRVSPPGTLTEITATATDGTPVRAWLALPDHASADRPAPLLVWLHGGPHTSWSGWSWRWNPWLMTARGYAVLMPDPGLSTGYGDSFAGRGWGAWGAEPYDDVLVVTDAAEAHSCVAAARTAVMGGSFGGYLANWIAGHTDRFAAIVSHAGIWALDQFGPTSDLAFYWLRELTPDRHVRDSPHHSAHDIRTPVLIVHGGHDSRVPLGESVRMWSDLRAAATSPDTPHRFLHFPTDSHAVSAPQNVKVWFETVFAFLDSTVRGLPWSAPDILG